MPREIPADVQKLIDIYTKAQEDLVRTIAEKETNGNVIGYQKSLLSQVMGLLRGLDNEAKEWTNDVIPEYYKQGIAEANQALRELGEDIDTETSFNQIHQGAINTLVKNTYADLNDANNFVGRRIQDIIRQSSIDEVTNKFATGLTVKELKNNIINKFVNQGINGIKDKRGRNISLDAYASTVARSTTREATNTATKNQLTSLGYDLVKMSSHLTTCPLCSMYQGRVYSISGQNSDYPPLDTAFSGDYANIHPNCRHVLMPYIRDLDDNADELQEHSNRPFEIAEKDKKAIDDYNKQQKDKRQLRADRDQYQRYRLVMPEDTPKSFANFRQMKNSNSERWQGLQKLYKSIMGIGRQSKVEINSWQDFKGKDFDFKNKKEIQSHLKEKYNIKFSDSKKYPIQKDLLQDSVNWLDKFHDYFKGFKETDPVVLPAFKIKSGIEPVGYYSYFESKPEAVEIVLNALFFTDKKSNMDYVESCIKTNWTVANAKGHKTFVHEYGHHVANSLKWLEVDNGNVNNNWCKNFINETIDEYNKVYNKNIEFKDISSLVSNYGGTKPEEAFAEAFAEYFGGEQPRDFAQVFGKKVEQKIKHYINK